MSITTNIIGIRGDINSTHLTANTALMGVGLLKTLLRLLRSWLNRSYWLNKIKGNQRRDKKTVAALIDLGWKAKIIWECQIKNGVRLNGIISGFIKGNANYQKGMRYHGRQKKPV